MSEIEKLVKRLRAYPARSATGGKDPLSVGNVCALLDEAATAIAALKGAEGALAEMRDKCCGCLRPDEKDETITELIARAEKAEAERDEWRARAEKAEGTSK